MKNERSPLVEQFSQLPPERIKQLLAKQAEELWNRPPRKTEDLTNAEIAALDDFKKFCDEKGYEPTKRQASKHRQEFIDWQNEKYKK